MAYLNKIDINGRTYYIQHLTDGTNEAKLPTPVKDDELLLRSQVVNSVTSSASQSGSRVPLSAYQGYLLNSKVNNEILDREADVDEEQARAEAAEKVLTDNLAQEVTDRINAVTTEQNRAIAKENEITTALTTETNRAKAAEEGNATAIATEKSRAEGIEANMTASIAELKNSRLEIVDATSSDYDMDVIFTSGEHCKIYKTNSNTQGTPYKYGEVTFTRAYILSSASNTGYGKQIAYIFGGPTFERTLKDGVIGPWVNTTGCLANNNGIGVVRFGVDNNNYYLRPSPNEESHTYILGSSSNHWNMAYIDEITLADDSKAASQLWVANNAVNKNGDTMTGALTAPSPLTISANEFGYILFTDSEGNPCNRVHTATSSHRMRFYEYGADNSGFSEQYALPTPDNGLTENKTYHILTEKNAVTIKQGGTGATDPSTALANLGGLEVIDARSDSYDMDAIFQSGEHCKLYRTDKNTKGTPYNKGNTTFQSALVLSFANTSNNAKQIAYVAGQDIYERTLKSGEIGDWRNLSNNPDVATQVWVESKIQEAINAAWEAEY